MEILEIKQFMKEKKITQIELSKLSGVPLQTLRYIFCGKTPNPRKDTMEKITSALGLNEPRQFDVFSIPGIEPLPTFTRVPLVGTIACGTPTLAEENIEEYIKMDTRIKADFCLRCSGSSMINARIFDGDIVFIREQPDVENGEIAAVSINNEATLKRVYKYPSRLELRAENPTFTPLNYEGEELKNIRILGKAVAFISVVQ